MEQPYWFKDVYFLLKYLEIVITQYAEDKKLSFLRFLTLGLI